MFAMVRQVLKRLERVLAQLDAKRLGREASVQMFQCFAKIEKLGAAGKALCAHQVSESGAWFDTGQRSPAHFVASVAGHSSSPSM